MVAEGKVVEEIQQWLRSVVLGLNLCPFAKLPYEAGRVRFEVCQSAELEVVLEQLQRWLRYMDKTPEADCETLLVITPNALADFIDYNQFLDVVDYLLEENGWEGVYQIATFHPDYQFAETDFDDVTNYTNRAPYPIFHILRDSSVSRVVQSEEHIEQVIARNQKTLRDLSSEQFKALFSN